MSARRIVIVLAVVAVGVATYTSRHRGIQRRSNPAVLRISFAFSPNQEQLVLPLIRRFNAERYVSRGRVVEIVGESISSGDAEAKIAPKGYRPTIWAPASSLWGRLLNYQADAHWVAD